MKKTTKILSLCLVCAVAIGCAVYFTPSSSADASSVTKNLWSIEDCYLSNSQNIKIDTTLNKKTDTVDYNFPNSGDGVTSNINVVNGATYTASCVYSFDNYEATFRRVAFFVYCYDRDGNKMALDGLISGLDYESGYGAYGSPDVGYSSSLTDYSYSVNFTINSINIAYIAVKFGCYASSLQTGLTIKFPMVELGNTKTDYIKSDKGYDSGYIDGKKSVYNVLNPCSTFVHGGKLVVSSSSQYYNLIITDGSFIDKADWVNNPTWQAAEGGVYVTKSGYYSTFSSMANSSNYRYYVQSIYSLGSMTYEDFMASDLQAIYYCTDEGAPQLGGGFNTCIEIRKTDYQNMQEALEDSFALGSQKGYEAGKQSANDLARLEGYDSGYLDGKTKGYQDGLNDGEGAISIGVGTVSTMFSGMASLLNVKVFGSVPLAAFLGIPLLFGLILFVLKIVRG